MADCGVSLNSDGQSEVDGSCEADMGQGEQVRDQVEEDAGLLDEGDHLGQPEHDHGKYKIEKVVDGKRHQKKVKILLEFFPCE